MWNNPFDKNWKLRRSRKYSSQETVPRTAKKRKAGFPGGKAHLVELLTKNFLIVMIGVVCAGLYALVIITELVLASFNRLDQPTAALIGTTLTMVGNSLGVVAGYAFGRYQGTNRR
jgi:hypothetical protein